MSSWRAAAAALVATRGELMANLSGVEPDLIATNRRIKTKTSAAGGIDFFVPVIPRVEIVCKEDPLFSSYFPCPEQSNSPTGVKKTPFPPYAPETTGTTGFNRTPRDSDAEATVARWRRHYEQLCVTRPASGWFPKRWRQLQIDVGLFVDEWAPRALQLGWSEMDLFGVHQAKSFARIDAMGLVPLLNGKSIIEMTESTAVMLGGPGVRLTYRRSPVPKSSGKCLPIWHATSVPVASTAIDDTDIGAH